MSDGVPALAKEEAEPAFACELNDTKRSIGERRDPEQQPSVLLPTGVRTDTVYLVGALAKTELLDTGNTDWRGRLVDPTAHIYVNVETFETSMSDLQPEEHPEAYVAVLGRPRTRRTPDGTKYVSVYPESVTKMNEQTWCREVHETADRTMERIANFDGAMTEAAALARERYAVDVDQYRVAVSEARNAVDEPPDEVYRSAP